MNISSFLASSAAPWDLNGCDISVECVNRQSRSGVARRGPLGHVPPWSLHIWRLQCRTGHRAAGWRRTSGRPFLQSCPEPSLGVKVNRIIWHLKLVRFILPHCMECRRGLAMRILPVCLSVCLSVRPSVCQTSELWLNGKKSVHIFIPYERPYNLIFWEKERLVGATPSIWIFGSTGPRWSEITDSEQIITRSASAVTPSDKSSINFHYALSNEPKMNIVRCP